MQRRHLTLIVVGCLFIAAVLSTTARAQPGTDDPMYRDSRRLMWIAQAVHAYAQKNDGRIPPDLAAAFPFITEEGVVSSIKEHSEYVYLGKPDVALHELPAWGEIVIAHGGLDEKAQNSNPGDLNATVTMLDEGTFIMPRAEARRLVEESEQVIEAVRTGKELPERFQLVFDLSAVGKAIQAYVKAHEGVLPPTLGDCLDFVVDSKRTHTPRQRAGVFLSPRVRMGLHIPEEPTAEWVNQHTPFVYLGGGGVKLAEVEDPQRTILVHVRPEDATTLKDANGKGEETLPVVTGWGGVDRAKRAYYDWVIPYSKAVMESARSGASLPDAPRAMRDIRFILNAIQGYAKAHDGLLPPDLGATVAYLPEETFAKATAAEKARGYLSPRAARVTQPPEDADAAWIAGHATYKYLGDARITWKEARETSSVVLVHVPLDEEMMSMQYNMEAPYRVTPTGHSSGHPELYPTQHLQGEIDRSKEEIQRMVRKEPVKK